MLRSTGFFRGIDCPFVVVTAVLLEEEGDGGGQQISDRCGRPYCHFRHGGGSCGRARPGGFATGSGNSYNSSRHREMLVGAARPGKELCYDPYNPELPKVSCEDEDGVPSGLVESPNPGILELELVNKAIEAVKNEMEREQKKYEDLLEKTEEYKPTTIPTQTAAKSKVSLPISESLSSSLEYDPLSSYQLKSKTDYNPTPVPAKASSSKYTLDTYHNPKSKGTSLEYIPTAVTKPVKYSAPVNHKKYVIDNSKPSTDLEYDPLSNYSARLLNKSSAKDQKGTKRSRENSQDELYCPTPKKLCYEAETNTYSPEATFSDSDDELTFEYQPSPVGCLKSRIGTDSEVSANLSPKEKGSQLNDSGLKELKETAVQYDMDDLISTKNAKPKDSETKNMSKPFAGKGEKFKSNEKEVKEKKNKDRSKEKLKSDKVGCGDARSNKEAKNKEKNKDKSEEKGKSAKKEEKPRDKGKERTGEKGLKEDMRKVQSDGCLSKTEKQKLNMDGAKTDKPKDSISPDICRKVKSKNSSEGFSTFKSDNTNKKDSKTKAAANAKNGGHKLDNRSNNKNRKKREGKPTESSKVREKKEGCSSKEGEQMKAKPKEKKRTLSHVDLFGDESGDEEEGSKRPVAAVLNISTDDGDSDDNSSGNKRGKCSKLPAASVSSSSSSEEDNIDYCALEKELDFGYNTMEECLRIFNESKEVKTEDKGRQGKQAPNEEKSEEKTESTLTTLFPGQKRRISHLAKQGNIEPPTKPVIRPYRCPTAKEICYQRMQLAQQQAAQLAGSLKTTMPGIQKTTSLTAPGEKRRIAHTPKAALCTTAKQAMSSVKKSSMVASSTSSNVSGTSGLILKARTSAAMASKTSSSTAQKRVAHTPTLQSTSLKRPVIPVEFGAKVPTTIRQRYLNFFIDECLKVCPSDEEAFSKVQTSPASNNRMSQSHESVLGGKLAAKTSFTLNRSGSRIEEKFTGASFYRKLKEYILTEEQLKENGYPRPHPEKAGRAVVFTGEEKKSTDSSMRICCRCGAEYMVSASGNCIRKEECVHHWGRLRRQRVPGGWETHYSCCSGAVGSPGCQVAKQHVQDGRKENFEGFVKTFEKSVPSDGNLGVFALDCEMCYTKQGLELTRVTVINSELKVVYDTFVKPDSKVVDYNTRFSGVTEEDLESATINIRDVQAVLLSMFSADTILIGHSLESDLFALKLIHSTVVDTAVVFPHRLGFPYKRALKTLMADYLKRIIQDSVEGHDSSEDAGACMELMIWKIKEDAKVKR
nr:PREDICTED: RNA exonuclease 1 homolog [Latimeria chalumnae]|eukprot:XP_014341551.1 PREDICTED: RNA exonuclease 1 homolog [Latimeria chalumnae]